MQITTAIYTVRGQWTGLSVFNGPHSTVVNVHQFEHKVVHWRSSHSFASSREGGAISQRHSHLLLSTLLLHRLFQSFATAHQCANTYSLLPNKRWLGHHTSWLKKNSRAGLLLQKVLPLNTNDHYRIDPFCSNTTSHFLEFWTLGSSKLNHSYSLRSGFNDV